MDFYGTFPMKNQLLRNMNQNEISTSQMKYKPNMEYDIFEKSNSFLPRLRNFSGNYNCLNQ